MSISVNLKRITNLPGRYDRKVELSFRGFTHKTKCLKCENLAIFNENFRWPHYGKRISDEVLCVSVYNGSKVFSDRLLGKLVISLQHVVTSGRLLLREPLTDGNYSQTDIYIELDVRYHPLQGAAGGWEGDDFLTMEDEEDSSGLILRNTGFVEPEASGKKVHTERLERETRRLGRGLLATGSDDEDDDDDDDDDLSEMDSINITFTPLLSRSRPLSRRDLAAVPRVQSFQVNVNILEAQKLSGVNINPAVFVRLGEQKRNTTTQKSTNFPFYNENFMFEFHETPELLFDKVIQITVVHRKLLPFLMDRIGIFKIDINTIYNQPDHRLHQKWAPLCDPDDTRAGIKGYVKASLSVIMKGDPMATPPPTNAASDDIERNLMLPRGMPAERPWARFLVRVYRAEGLPSMDSGFLGAFSKMREKKVFIDPYVRVTFAGQQGETSVASSTNCPVWNEQISFIEQFPPLARRIRIQILDDANIGNVAVATHFLDLQEISDHTRNGFNPTFGPSWVNLYGSPKNSSLGDVHQAFNQGLGQGIFYRGRILLALSVEVYTSPVATETGPATGKAKGALGRLGMKKKSRKSNEKNNQEEDGEAGSEVPESVAVEVEEIHPLPEDFFGEKEEFLLFASLFEVTMMDPGIGKKPVIFEMSIGNYGKAVTVSQTKKTNVGQSREDLSRSRDELRRSREDLDEESHGLLEMSEVELDRDMENPEAVNRSLSVPFRPQPTEYDKSFSCIPLQPPLAREKPCLHIWSQFEDHIFRYHSGNWLHKMADRLDSGVEEVDHLLRRPRSNAKGRLVEVLLELVASCKQYIAHASKKTQSKPNNLDKCRREFLKKNIILVAKQALRARRRLTRRVAKQRLADTRKILRKLRLLAKEPQSTIPDVFLWLLSGGRRVAYCRIPIHSILFSLVEEQRGRDCGKLTTLYMKAPEGAVGDIFAKLEVYMWMGVTKYAKESLNCLPGEFLHLFEEEEGGEVTPAHLALQAKKAPVKLSCQDSRYFQLRAHIYQARGILAADDNGLSDPYAKVLFSTQCQVTRVLGETLSPAWCELLLFDRVLMEGRKEELRDDPPLVIISLFDYDTMGGPDPLGLAFAEPEFKFVEEPYRKPQLRFFDINLGKAAAGELLATFELIELDYSGYGEPCLPADVDPREPQFLTEENCYIIPEGVRPVLKTFRIEVLFWGLRDLRRVQLFEVERPQVRVECGGNRLESEEMDNYKLNPNFKEIIKYFDVELPEVPYLQPPLSIFVVEQRAFGRIALVGSHIVPSLMAFAPPELGDELDDEEEEKPKLQVKPETPLNTVKGMDLGGLSIKQSKIPINPLNLLSPLLKSKAVEGELEEETPEKSELDWWSKYYASIEELDRQSAMDEEAEELAEADGGTASMLEEEEAVILEMEAAKPKRKKIATLKLYFCELEDEFNQFMDWLHTFPLFKGKASGDDDDGEEDDRTMGKYKGSFLIYPITPEDEDEKCRIINGIPKNAPVKVLLRVYMIKATNLAPRDASKKPDPYLVVKVGQQSMDTKDRYIAKQFNPVFGEVFELTVSFPLETDLSVLVYDHNLVGSDDVIGETRIDLENRFYSRHYAGCGLAQYYDPDGYNMWRDASKPTTILTDLCRKNGIPAPEFRVSEVKVLNMIFKIPPEAFPEELLKKNTKTDEEEEEMDEHKALSVLQRWELMREFCPNAIPLVPEHVEMRALMNPDRPGLPRGYAHMWIDMFPVDVPAPPPINIKPRLPIDYELRVIIWNTDDVLLGVNPFTGAPSSDIYVKGWIKGLDDDKQETDVHFFSLTGEGNFNWRFIFRFSYLPTEKEIVYQKKESIFSVDKTEFRQPAVLVLQVWDYDIIGSNDFIGSIELRLSDMVRASKASGKCTIQMAKERAVPRFSIFRSKRMKGWWPLIRQRSKEDIEKEEKEKEEEKKSGKKTKKKDKRSEMKPEDIQFTDSGGDTFILTGKVEAELQLVTLEEAEAAPVGRKRKEPEPLDKPDRPSLSFSWFLNPLKTFVFYIWKNYKKYIIALFILAILTVFLVLILYTLPNQISTLIIHG